MNLKSIDIEFFEKELSQRAQDATILNGIIEVAKTSTVTLFCSDCCGSNGNDCIPS